MKMKLLITIFAVLDIVLTYIIGRSIVGIFHVMGATFITISDVVDAYVVPFALISAGAVYALIAISQKPKINKLK